MPNGEEPRAVQLRQDLGHGGRVEGEPLVDRRPQRGDGLGVPGLAGRQQQLHRRVELFVLRMAAGGVADPEQVGLATVLEIPHLLRRGQAFPGQRVVVVAQGAAGRRQSGGGAVVEGGGGGGERQAVVVRRIRI